MSETAAGATAGAAAGTAADRKRTANDWRVYVAGALLVVLLLMGIGAARLANVERNDRDTNRATAFRLCSRNRTDRAYAHARERGLQIKGEPAPLPMSRHERAVRLEISRALMDPSLLPLLDCEPNLRGHGARPLPLREQEDYVRRWAAGALTPEQLGVCPNSHLEGEHPPGRC